MRQVYSGNLADSKKVIEGNRWLIRNFPLISAYVKKIIQRE